MPPAAAPPPAQPCPAAVSPVVAATLRPALYDLRWQLRVGRDETHDLPEDLHAFTVGRWECALGKVQMDDEREPDRLRLKRTRRLACTHASGTTVQTSLSCELITGAPAFAHSLPLSLDTAPALTLACSPVEVERVHSVLGTVCAGEAGVTYCAAP